MTAEESGAAGWEWHSVPSAGQAKRGGGRGFRCADGTECHPYRRETLLRRKDVSETAFQAAHDLAEAAEGDALVGALQAVERGGRQAELFGKLGVGHFAALDAEKFAELAFQGSGHASQARGELIPDAECFAEPGFTSGVDSRSLARIGAVVVLSYRLRSLNRVVVQFQISLANCERSSMVRPC